jgi:hypothetical protein
LTADESTAFIEAISRPEARTCLDLASLTGYATTFAWTAQRAAVPRLLDVPVTTYEEQLELAKAVTILPDAAELLLAAEAREPDDAGVAAGVALYTSRTACSRSSAPCRELSARWSRRLASRATPRPEIIDALAEQPDEWPPELPAILLERFEHTTSRRTLLSLARALEAAPTGALSAIAKRAAVALRQRAAGLVDTELKASLNASANRIMQRAGLEPMPEFEAGTGLTALGESGGGSGPCDPFHARLRAILRVRGSEQLEVRYAKTHDEPGPALKSGDVPWLIEGAAVTHPT